MSDPAATRTEMQNRQRAWMAQRQAEADRRNAQASLGLTAATSNSAGPSDAAAVAANGPEVLDRLAEQIAERLQVEVRKENAKLMQEGAVGAQVESLLERHIGSNTCPICFELMTGKERQPTLLFPCGHTFCAACLRMHLDQLERKTCPYCREKVASHAPNISLQQVIDGFVERQQSLARGEVLSEVEQSLESAAAAHQPHYQPPRPLHMGGGVGGGAGGGEAAQYAAQYRTYSMRCRVMRNQLLDSRAEAAALHEKSVTANKVFDHLTREEAAAQERLEAARLDLEVVQSQMAEQAAKCQEVASRRRELEQMEELVEQTFSGLEGERQKALLLVRNFDPTLADELQRDVEDEGFE